MLTVDVDTSAAFCTDFRFYNARILATRAFRCAGGGVAAAPPLPFPFPLARVCLVTHMHSTLQFEEQGSWAPSVIVCVEKLGNASVAAIVGRSNLNLEGHSGAIPRPKAAQRNFCLRHFARSSRS